MLTQHRQNVVERFEKAIFSLLVPLFSYFSCNRVNVVVKSLISVVLVCKCVEQHSFETASHFTSLKLRSHKFVNIQARILANSKQNTKG